MRIESQPAVSGFEKRAITALASLYVVRMLGLFMVLPVLVLYGDQYEGSTPALLGLALGAYGLTQALLQIPFGLWSDRFGRKLVIAIGLLIFTAGSVVAAMAESIGWLIIGRCLQGAGAVAGAIMALVADSTSEQNRTKAMAAVGASIGVAFAVSMVLGPLISQWGGLKSLFWLTAGLAVIGLLVLIFAVPAVRSYGAKKRTYPFKQILLDRSLLRLNVSVFILHCVLMMSFIVVPGLLASSLGLDLGQHWQVYLPVVLLSFVLMVPLIIVAEKKAMQKAVLVIGITLLALSQLAFAAAGGQPTVLIAALLVFFVGFNVLEASLPSMLTKLAPVAAKGGASGVYSTSQFLGTFVGGAGGGLLLSIFGTQALFGFALLLLVLWLLVVVGLKVPSVASVFINPPEQRDLPSSLRALEALPGVREVVLMEGESCLHLRVDKLSFDHNQIKTAMDSAQV